MKKNFVTPFEIRVDNSVLLDLNNRLKLTRWPDEIPSNNWKYGADKAFLQKLVDYWITDYDWRANENFLNKFDQFKVKLPGVDLHFIHQKGKGPNPMPLLLSHGWPGSVFEFLELIPMLTDPESYGGDPRDSFTVVAPSLPGFNFSFEPDQQRFSASQIADLFAQLMHDILGYSKFAAQGGDWGSFITTRLAFAHPELLHGIHLNLLAVRRDPDLLKIKLSREDQKYESQLKHFLKEEIGYQWIQGTKPQTLSYGLNDSPVGLAAWIIEKFFSWTDCKGDLESYLGKDKLLTNIMIYWITGSIGSSFWPYYARHHGEWPVPDGKVIDVPTGYIQFPKEILQPPKQVAAAVYKNIQRWTVENEGGHFAAMEQPKVLAREIKAFFRKYR